MNKILVISSMLFTTNAMAVDVDFSRSTVVPSESGINTISIDSIEAANKAYKVNFNLQDDLKLAINSYQERSLDSNTESSGGATCNGYFHTVTYNKRESQTGDVVSIHGQTFRIYKFPFVEFGSGDRYTIKIPLKENSFLQIDTSHRSPTENSCSTVMSSPDEQVVFNVNESRKVSFRHFSDQKEITSSYSVGVSLHFFIGETSIHAQSAALSYIEEEISVSNTDYDFSDNLSYGNMINHQGVINDLDNLIDYVEIEKIN